MTDVTTVKDKLKDVKLDEWYSKVELKKMHIYHSSLMSEENSSLVKIKDKERYVLGASIVRHYNGTFGLDLPDSIDANKLALAMEDIRVHQYVLAHPEVQDKGKGISVRAECLSKFKNFFTPAKEMTEDVRKSWMTFLPEFPMNLKTLAYISKHRDKSIEELSRETKVDSVLVQAAKYKLGYDQPKGIDQVKDLGERLFIRLNPKAKPWKSHEDEKLRELYFFNHLSKVATSLKREEKDVEFRARILGIAQFSDREEYTISEVLQLSRIPYDQLQQALFRGDLETRIFQPENMGEKDEFCGIPTGAVLIKGNSLLSFFRNKKTGKEWVKKRADKYIEGKLKKDRELYRQEEIGDYVRLLTGKERFSPMKLLNAYTSKYPLLSKKEENELVRIKDNSFLAMNDFVEANIRSAIWMAKKNFWRAKGKLEFEDVVHDAVIGLIRGAQKYNKDKHLSEYGRKERYACSTYFVWWMRQSILRGIIEEGDLVRIPSYKCEEIGKMNRAISYCIQKHHENPSLEEISKYSGLSVDRVGKLMKDNKIIITSLDKEINDSENSLKDLVEDKKAERSVDYAINSDTKKIIRDKVMTLSPRSRNIIMWRYGLATGEKMTLEEIGARLNISRQRVEQIQNKVLEKLRLNRTLKKLSGNNTEIK